MIRTAPLLFLLGSMAWANTIFVDLAGDDGQPGSREQPVRSIQRGIDLAEDLAWSTVYVYPGEYQESVLVNKSRFSLIGVGMPSIGGVTYGLNLAASDLSVEGFRIHDCTYGVAWYGGAGVSLKRCRIVANNVGLVVTGNATDITLTEVDVCCSNSIGLYLGNARYVIDRCTVADNLVGLRTFSTAAFIRNSIFAFNHNAGLKKEPGYGPEVEPNLSHNDVYGNGSGNPGEGDYVDITPGATDIQVDPLFTDLARDDFSLKSASPLINAGQGQSGLPTTIGAHEIGTRMSAEAGAAVQFSSWTDATGTSVTNAGAAVTLGGDGLLRLNGSDTAAALSPVIDLGDDSAKVTKASYRAIEDLLLPSGSRRVVDADGNTFEREFRIRVSSGTFGPLDAQPAWVSTTNEKPLDLPGRFLQVEIVLTKVAR